MNPIELAELMGNPSLTTSVFVFQEPPKFLPPSHNYLGYEFGCSEFDQVSSVSSSSSTSSLSRQGSLAKSSCSLSRNGCMRDLSSLSSSTDSYILRHQSSERALFDCSWGYFVDTPRR